MSTDPQRMFSSTTRPDILPKMLSKTLAEMKEIEGIMIKLNKNKKPNPLFIKCIDKESLNILSFNKKILTTKQPAKPINYLFQKTLSYTLFIGTNIAFTLKIIFTRKFILAFIFSPRHTILS